MIGWHHQHDGLEFEQIPGDSERQVSLAFFSSLAFFGIAFLWDWNEIPNLLAY